MANLPPEYSFGFVAGRIVHAVADTLSDTDEFPDARPAEGSVVFLPLESGRRTSEALVIQDRIETPLDKEGRVTDINGNPGIWLYAGGWRAEFKLKSGSLASFAFELTSASTKDTPLELVKAAPYVPPTGAQVTTLLVPSGAVAGQVLGWSGEGPVWVDGLAAITAASGAAATSALAAKDSATAAAGSKAAAATSATQAGASATKAAGSATAAKADADRAAGALTLVGPGRPDQPATTAGIIKDTEGVGCEYRSTDGAGVGAWVWTKRPAGWVVTDGDTGKVSLVPYLQPGIFTGGGDPATGGGKEQLYVRRQNGWLYLEISLSWMTLASGTKVLDWKTLTGMYDPGAVYLNPGYTGGGAFVSAGAIILYGANAGKQVGHRLQAMVPIDASWPIRLTPTL